MPQVSYAVSRVLYLTIIYLVLQLPAKSSGRKGRERTHISPFSLASGGVYRAKAISSFSVVSYTTFPSLPSVWRFISVALSLGSPPQAVSLHHVLWMLGLSSSCDAIVCITDDIIIHNKLDFVKFLQIYSWHGHQNVIGLWYEINQKKGK